MATKFDSKIFRNKKQVYIKLPHHQGICWIYDWCNDKNQYIQRQAGKKYQCYKKIGKKQISESFESLNEAKRWRNSAGIFTAKSKYHDVTFDEVIKKFFNHNKSKWKITTFELYESYLKHYVFFSSINMNQINSFAVDEWLKHLKSAEYIKGQHSTRTSYGHELTLFKQVCTYFSEYMDETYIHPCKKRHNQDCIVDHQKYIQAKEKAKTKYMPVEDCKKFLGILRSEAEMDNSQWLYFYLAEFALLSGPRIGEICALDYKDIDFESGIIQISKTVQWPRNSGRDALISPSTKTGRPRPVTLPAILINSLKEWKLKSGRSNGLVFSDNPFAPIGYRSIQYRFNKAFKKMESKFQSTHIMRHSFATLWLTFSGGSVQSLQSQLGHSTAQQSMHYAKITDDLIKAGMTGFEKGLVGFSDVVPLPILNEIEGSGLGQAGNKILKISK